MTHTLLLGVITRALSQKNAELYEVAVVGIEEARDVALLHAVAVELEHGLAVVWGDRDGCRRERALRVRSADFNRQRPVLADRGVVDVDAEVLVWNRGDREPVRAPLAFFVFQLLDRLAQADVLTYDLSAEVAERDVEPARALLDPVGAVPQGLGLLDGVLDRLCLARFYND